jgi:hypothetical protein
VIFGLVTRAELERRVVELREELKKSDAELEEMKFEWAKWFNKFRSLYAMLLKREKNTAPGDEEPAPADPRQRPLFPNSRRSF